MIQRISIGAYVGVIGMLAAALSIYYNTVGQTGSDIAVLKRDVDNGKLVDAQLRTEITQLHTDFSQLNHEISDKLDKIKEQIFDIKSAIAPPSRRMR